MQIGLFVEFLLVKDLAVFPMVNLWLFFGYSFPPLHIEHFSSTQ